MNLSIILTIYNKEPYLNRSLEALLSQDNTTSSDYEVIAVNDGSTDDSATVLNKYASHNPHLKIITQQNQGLSMARNNGVLHASGNYIWFVDADDVVSKKSVRLILEAIEQQPDLIPIYAITEGVDSIRNKINPQLLTGKEVLIESKWEHCGVFWIIKKQFLIDNELKFVPGIYHEDAEFTPRMLYLAQNVVVIPEILYTVYHGDQQSITEVPRPKRAYDMVDVVARLIDFFEKKGEQHSVIGKVMSNNNSGILNTALYVISCNEKAEWKKFNEYLYNKRLVLRSFHESNYFKYRLEGLLMNMFRKQYVSVFVMFRKIIERKSGK